MAVAGVEPVDNVALLVNHIGRGRDNYLPTAIFCAKKQGEMMIRKTRDMLVVGILLIAMLLVSAGCQSGPATMNNQDDYVEPSVTVQEPIIVETTPVPSPATEVLTTSQVITPTITPTLTATTELTGAVACPFGRVNDPYPGQCKRYVDANDNGICDLSEPGSGD